MIQLLSNYAKNNAISIINEKNDSYDYPFLYAVKMNSIEIVKLLLKYARECQVLLEIEDDYFYKPNENTEDEKFINPLLCSIEHDNKEIVKLIMDYANETNITLEINRNHLIDRPIEMINYPLICAIKKNNFEIVKLLMDYANKNNIVLDLHEKYNNRIFEFEFGKEYISNVIVSRAKYPISSAIENQNTEIMKLLIQYSKKNNIKLYINEKYINVMNNNLIKNKKKIKEIIFLQK
ncbi:hypothetical protein LY90DRAFT_504464 [Neocallimastix californiae]|uniref:Ankyrin n=1 Tax=Neocallimastix californiae TaxID=1754190 RepID=A0A1Y2E8U7_9FUNG|nr:hypothetical protein LY90DRAFT_504464 [Neocallimastix californiae]|eukprot:ORY67988.1 hypothetical protein LY90DRAFT_504464 [Neocallimastix californiae]